MEIIVMEGPALTYALLIIPTLFAVAVVSQGIYKATKGEKDGTTVMGFGIVFLLLIGVAYWLFIK